VGVVEYAADGDEQERQDATLHRRLFDDVARTEGAQQRNASFVRGYPHHHRLAGRMRLCGRCDNASSWIIAYSQPSSAESARAFARFGERALASRRYSMDRSTGDPLLVTMDMLGDSPSSVRVSPSSPCIRLYGRGLSPRARSISMRVRTHARRYAANSSTSTRCFPGKHRPREELARNSSPSFPRATRASGGTTDPRRCIRACSRVRSRRILSTLEEERSSLPSRSSSTSVDFSVNRVVSSGPAARTAPRDGPTTSNRHSRLSIRDRLATRLVRA